jgi:hypothetical protein
MANHDISVHLIRWRKAIEEADPSTADTAKEKVSDCAKEIQYFIREDAYQTRALVSQAVKLSRQLFETIDNGGDSNSTKAAALESVKALTGGIGVEHIDGEKSALMLNPARK